MPYGTGPYGSGAYGIETRAPRAQIRTFLSPVPTTAVIVSPHATVRTG
jgi:hypothetical protein